MNTSSRARATIAGPIGVIVALLLVLCAAAFLRSTPETHPVGDKAVLEIYTLHAARGDLSIGPYSRFGWNHPGPLYFYLLAPIYVLSGAREYGLDLAALAINLAVVAGMVFASARAAGWSLGLSVVGALTLYLLRPGGRAGMGDLLSSPWNPHVIVLPLGLLLIASAMLATQRIPRALPAVAVIGTFIAQTHVGLAPTVAVVVGVALAIWISRLVAARRVGAPALAPGSAARWLGATAALTVLLWTPPLLEEVRSTGGGNLTSMVTFLENDRRPGPSPATAVWALAHGASAAWRWNQPLASGRPLPLDDVRPGSAIWLAAQTGGLALALAWALSRRRLAHAALCGLSGAAWLAALWSVTNIRGELQDYLVFWTSVLAVVSGATIAAVLLSWAGAQLRARGLARSSRRAAIVSALFLVAVGAYGAAHLAWNYNQTQAFGRRFPQQRVAGEVLTAALAADLEAHGSQSPLIRMTRGTWSVGAGIVLSRYKSGAPVAVDTRSNTMFAPALHADGTEDAEFWLADRRLSLDTFRLVAEHDHFRLYARRAGPNADPERPAGSPR